MQRKYELVVVFDTDLNEEAVRSQIAQIASVADAHGGNIEKEDIWGRRVLSYRINKKEYGNYVVLVISGDSSLVVDLRRQLKINDSVLRFFVTTKDKRSPDMLEPYQDDSVLLGIGGLRDNELREIDLGLDE